MKKLLFSLLSMGLLIGFNAEVLAKDYTYETNESYVYHHFTFDKEEMSEMTKGPYKAKDYADWMLEVLQDMMDDWGANLVPVTNEAVLEFKLTSLARYAEREGEETLKIELKAKDNGDGTWSLELYDRITDVWKNLTE